MSIGIIGSGALGGNIARILAGAGFSAVIANRSGPAALVKGLAGAGKGELARGAQQQPRIEPGFQLLDAAAHGIRWQTQAARRAGKAATAHHLDKQRDIVKIEHVIPIKSG